MDKLPAVVQDAIVATRNLDERYLWVDLVCIDQNDPQDVQKQIERMDLIYRLADLTLIAVTAKDANSRLPGVQEPRKSQDHQLRAHGSRVYCRRRDLPTGSRISFWDTRGWTYQEEVLSRRRLYFHEAEVDFVCRQGTGSEFLDPAGPIVAGLQPEINRVWMSDDITLGWNFGYYADLVETYLKRNLSFESYILNAFQGLAAWLEDR